MGSRDYRHREPKKSKKEAKKILPTAIVQPPVMVEVIKKGKKPEEWEEEEK